MNKKLLITLLRKNVDDLTILADGFFDEGEIPQALITLARRQTEDIQILIDQLASLENATENVKTVEIFAETPATQTVEDEKTPEISEIKDENIVEDIAVQVRNDGNIEEKTIEEESVVPEIQIIEEKPVIAETQIETEIIVDEKEDDEYDEEDESDNGEDETEIEISVSSNFSTVADKLGHTSAHLRHENLYRTGSSIADTAAVKKVDDIRQAITLGDRFRFQKELFGSNGEDMNKTLNYINQLATYNETQAFLKAKYQWADDNETAQDFLTIVSRKFQ